MKPPYAMDRPEKKPLLNGRPDDRPCPTRGQDLAPLIELARQSGASDAKAVSTGDIVVDERLAGFCRESSCANYGLSKKGA